MRCCTRRLSRRLRRWRGAFRTTAASVKLLAVPIMRTIVLKTGTRGRSEFNSAKRWVWQCFRGRVKSRSRGQRCARNFAAGSTRKTPHSLRTNPTPTISRVRRRAGARNSFPTQDTPPSAARRPTFPPPTARFRTRRPAPPWTCATATRPSRPNGPARAANSSGHRFEICSAVRVRMHITFPRRAADTRRRRPPNSCRMAFAIHQYIRARNR